MTDIKSKPASKEYRDGWDRVFMVRKEREKSGVCMTCECGEMLPVDRETSERQLITCPRCGKGWLL